MARIILRDGRVAEFREAKDDETDRVVIKELFSRVSSESLYFRFFHAVHEVTDAFIDSLLVAGHDGHTLLCLAGDRALGMGTFTSLDAERAEVAFLVDDDLHGKGIGTLLLERMAEAAWQLGFTQFEAFVMENNYKMIQVFTTSGYQVGSQHDSGMIRLVLPLMQTERTRAFQEAREKEATAASLTPFFRPQTVAVVGASRDVKRLGHALFRNLLDGEFEGAVYPVNPSAKSVAGVRAYASLCDVPERIDLAILVIPADQALAVVDECVRVQTRAVMIISSGFSERNSQGAGWESEIIHRLRAAGCRLIGPNCLGLLNTSAKVRLNASFAPQLPLAGRLSIASQSGALGIAILGYASRIGVGVAHFVSMGNKADVSGNDLLQYWEDDTETGMIVLYLESFGNPRKFSRIARRITRAKPILAVKGGRTSLGEAVSEARTSAQPTNDVLVEALFEQAEIIRVDSLPELFDVAALLSDEVFPAGRRVAILTNTAGGAVMTVDALLKEGLELVHVPIDLGFDGLADGYRTVLPQLLCDPEVDAVMVIFISIGQSEVEAVSTAVVEAVKEADRALGADDVRRRKPVMANFLTTGEYSVRLLDAEARRIPVYPFPEQAVRALAKVTAYAEYRRSPRGHMPDLESVDGERARTVVRQTLGVGGMWLPENAVRGVLEAVGILSQSTESPQDQESCLAIIVEMDRLFGMMVGVSVIEQSRAAKPDMETVTDAQAIRIIPLTDLDSREIVRSICKEHDICVKAQEGIQDLLLRLSRLTEEVYEITKIMLPDVAVTDSGCVIRSCAMTVASGVR